MKAAVLDEPLLEFAGRGRDVDPRSGIELFGPADLASNGAPRRIQVGLIGEERDIAAAEAWLEKARTSIEAKEAKRQGLHPTWPGFDLERGFRAELVFDGRLRRPVRTRALAKLAELTPRETVSGAVDRFLEELAAMTEQSQPDVVICCIPDVCIEAEHGEAASSDEAPTEDDSTEEASSEEETDSPENLGRGPDFHDLLKARAMRHRVPLQLLRPGTFDASRRGTQVRRSWLPQNRQDDATVAWNILAALYYKAGGTPWRMARHSEELDTCFVGVSYYVSADGEQVHTSVAQVFNQRGDGVVVRGGPVTRSKEDRQLHLSSQDAHDLLKDALAAYRKEHRHPPARVVVHKTSAFDDNEREGMLNAADDSDLDSCELISVGDPGVRLFRDGQLPPLRGTLLELDRDQHVLYTRGSVEQYGCYPGAYVPRPLGFRLAHSERAPRDIAADLLALSKMNWNSTAFDGREPETVSTARRVGNIIKHVPPDEHLEPRYSFYM